MKVDSSIYEETTRTTEWYGFFFFSWLVGFVYGMQTVLVGVPIEKIKERPLLIPHPVKLAVFRSL